MGRPPRRATAAETAGLKCAPETGASTVISTAKMAPVGIVLHRRARAPVSPASFAAMMPEPTTVATSRPVPSASETRRRRRSNPTMLLLHLIQRTSRRLRHGWGA